MRGTQSASPASHSLQPDSNPRESCRAGEILSAKYRVEQKGREEREEIHALCFPPVPAFLFNSLGRGSSALGSSVVSAALVCLS